MDNTIIIRSACKIPKGYLNPCKIPGTNNYPDCVRKTNKDGELILSREDKDSGKTFIADTDFIEIYDGKVFNLDNVEDAEAWEAIKYHKCIAKDRDERDEKGDLVIDGNQFKYGTAEWYVEVPGREVKNKNASRRKRLTAQNYVLNDTPYDRMQKAKVLGKSVRNLHESDIEDFLMQEAEKNPDKIIDLYTSGDMALRLLFLEAREKMVIKFTNKLWMYGDIIMGTNEESAISYMKQPQNANVTKLLRQECFPDYYTQERNIEEPVNNEPLPITENDVKKPGRPAKK